MTRRALCLALVLVSFSFQAWATPGALYGTSCSVAGATNVSGPDATGNNFICDSGTITWKYPVYQFGSTAASCAASRAGALQWTGSALQLCDGTSWGSLGFTNNGITLGTSVTAANPQISGDATSGLFTPIGSTLAITTGGIERLRVTSAGYVGIGTTVPLSALSVSGGVAIGTSYAGSNAAALNNLIVQGNIGIGTTSPNDLLYITGVNNNGITINTNSGFAVIHFQSDSHIWQFSTGGSGYSPLQGYWYLADQTTNYTPFSIAPNDNINIGNNSLSAGSSSTLTVFNNATGGATQELIQGGAAAGDVTTNQLFRINQGGGTTGVFVVQGNGNVGIGTAAPATQLQIEGGASNTFAVFTNNSAGHTLNDGFKIGVDTGAQAYLWNSEGTPILFATAGTIRMRLDSNGHLNIGPAASPPDQLDVAGAIGITTTTSTAPTVGLYSAATNTLAFTTSGSTAMTITSTGFVGIGTTLPQATLDVTGFAHLSLNSSAPATCSSSNMGSVALTHLAQVCVCDTTPAWHVLNTGTACSW